jgi:hypothetical protein
MDHVLHEEPEGFERKGAAIVACPCCKERGHGKDLSFKERTKLAAALWLGDLLGDDLDGYAVELENLGLTGSGGAP